MAGQGSKSTLKGKRPYVMASVRLDAATHAKVSAIASLEGMDKSAWMSRVITAACSGIVVIDRRKPAGPVESSGEVDRPEEV